MRAFLATTLAVAALGLAGCNTPKLDGPDSTAKLVLGNLQGCQRVYTANVGGITPSASLTIICEPTAKAAPAAESKAVVWGGGSEPEVQ